MTSQMKDRARSANDHDNGRDTGHRDTDGFGAAGKLTTALPEQARETAVKSIRQLQDSGLGQARAAISGGYDVFAHLLAGQRRFVDTLIDQQRSFTEALLTPLDHR